MSIILKEIIMHVLMRKTEDKREREREIQVGVASAGRPRNSADWCVYGGHADWWPW